MTATTNTDRIFAAIVIFLAVFTGCSHGDRELCRPRPPSFDGGGAGYELTGYLERFYDALNYDSFKEGGYPIGSGEIESSHKSIPQKRLKIPGVSWHPDSIDPMLTLRILRADDWWDDFWNKRTEELKVA